MPTSTSNHCVFTNADIESIGLHLYKAVQSKEHLEISL